MRRSVLLSRLKRYPENAPLDELPDDHREAFGELMARGAGEAFAILADGGKGARRDILLKRLGEIDALFDSIDRALFDSIDRLMPRKEIGVFLAREDDRSLRRVFDAVKVMLAELRETTKTERAFQDSLNDSRVLKRLILFCREHVDVFELPRGFEPDEWLSAGLIKQVPRLCSDARVAHAVRHLLNALVDADVLSALFGGGGLAKAAQVVTARMTGMSPGSIEKPTRNPMY
ncbi:MAG: hypothetical protein HYY84_12340 [Deltaproteobacteria bacterium]|nr:hypothetical protein [Deltaproteobacteria bacterium]